MYRTSQYPTNLETTRHTPPRTSSLGPAGRWCSIPLHSLLSHVSNRDPACHHLQPGARNDDKAKVSNSMTGLPYTGGISDALSSQVSPQSLSNQAECGVAQTEAEGFSRAPGRIWKNLEEETPLQACHADTSTLTSILYKGVQFQTVQWPPVFFFLIPVACLQPFRRKRMAVFGPFKHMRGVGCYLLGLSFNRKGCMGPIQAE